MKIIEYILAGILFLVLSILFFWDSIGLGSIIGGGDNLFFFIPIRKLWIQIAQSFSFPLWNPHANTGMPLFATIQPAILYPFSWFYFLFSFNSVFNLTIVFHYSLAGFFMYCLVRNWRCGPEAATVSAFSFMFSGYLFSIHRYLSTLLPVVWVPLLLLLLFSGIIKNDKRFVMGASLVAAAMIFSGGIETCYQVFPIMVILGLFPSLLFDGKFEGGFWNRFRLLALFGIILIGVTIVQVWPTLELSHWSVRRYGLGDYEANVWSLKLKELFLFFTLDFFGYFGNVESYYSNQNWLQTLYVGIPSFILALYSFKRLGNKSLIMVSIVAISVLLALGKNGFLFPYLREHLPLFDSFRYPIKFIFPTVLVVSICAGLGFEQLKNDIQSDDKKEKIVKGILFLGVVFILCFGFIELYKPFLINRFEFWKIIPPSYNEPWVNLANLQRLFVFASIFCLFLFFASKKSRRNSWFLVLSVAVLGFDLFFGNHGLVFTISSRDIHRPSQNMSFLANQPGVFRTYVTKETKKDYYKKKVKSGKITYEEQARFIRSLTGLAYGISYLEGQTVMRPYFFENFRGILNTMPLKNRFNLLNLLNAKYIVSAEKLDLEGLKLIRTEPGGFTENLSKETLSLLDKKDSIKVYENEKVYPRAFLIGSCHVVKNEGEYPVMFSKDDFNPEKLILLNESPKEFDCDNGIEEVSEAESVNIIKYWPNHIEMVVNAEKKRMLFLSDAYFPGWEAKIDGNDTEIYRSHYAFRSIVVNPGSHRVLFEYNPVSFRVGMVVSILTLLFVVLGFSPKIRLKIIHRP